MQMKKKTKKRLFSATSCSMYHISDQSFSSPVKFQLLLTHIINNHYLVILSWFQWQPEDWMVKTQWPAQFEWRGGATSLSPSDKHRFLCCCCWWRVCVGGGEGGAAIRGYCDSHNHSTRISADLIHDPPHAAPVSDTLRKMEGRLPSISQTAQ